jgi:hypothetical protein
MDEHLFDYAAYEVSRRTPFNFRTIRIAIVRHRSLKPAASIAEVIEYVYKLAGICALSGSSTLLLM